MYEELKCFIKPLTRLETSSTFLNSRQQILQKIQFFWVLIGREVLSIIQMLFSIDRTGIE